MVALAKQPQSNRPNEPIQKLRSPVTWIGGKYYLAHHIVRAFPPAEDYDTYVEPFCGACHVLMARPYPSKQVEIVSDKNENLINFFLCLRDRPEELLARLAPLPYSRALYYRYHASLFSDEPLDDLERAARWFYVVRSTVNASIRKTPKGWNCALTQGQCRVRAMATALSLFEQVAQRLKSVSIDNRDFAKMISLYSRPRTLFYVDPPYLGSEYYYDAEAAFSHADHEQLAHLLNTTSAKVALSYYDCPELETWYPSSRWQRITWAIAKRSQRGKATLALGQEVLLLNYGVSSSAEIWQEQQAIKRELWEVQP